MKRLLFQKIVKLLGFFGKDEEIVIPWQNIIKIGEDVILVKYKEMNDMRHGRRRSIVFLLLGTPMKCVRIIKYKIKEVMNMEPFVLKEKEYFSLANWIQKYPNLTVGFTTKNGGNSKDDFESLNIGFHVKDHVQVVCENREIVAKNLTFPTQNWVGAQQTHEINIKKISKHEKGKGANEL